MDRMRTNRYACRALLEFKQCTSLMVGGCDEDDRRDVILLEQFDSIFGILLRRFARRLNDCIHTWYTLSDRLRAHRLSV